MEKDCLKVQGEQYVSCKINYELNSNDWLKTANVSSKVLTFKNTVLEFMFDDTWKAGINISSSDNWQTANLSYIIPENSNILSIIWVINLNEADNLFYLKNISLTIQ